MFNGSNLAKQRQWSHTVCRKGFTGERMDISMAGSLNSESRHSDSHD